MNHGDCIIANLELFCVVLYGVYCCAVLRELLCYQALSSIQWGVGRSFFGDKLLPPKKLGS